MISWFPRALIPADALEVEESLSEGVSIETSLKVSAFLGDGGRLKAIRFVPTVPGPPDAKGIPWPVQVEDGKPVEIEFERAVVAIGQTGNPVFFGGYTENFATPGGLIRVDGKGSTCTENVFAAGDAVTGPSTVISAMASGRAAARAVHSYLTGAAPEPCSFSRPQDLDFPPITPDIPSIPRAAMSENHSASNRGLFVEADPGLTENQVRSETSRCLQCGVCRSAPSVKRPARLHMLSLTPTIRSKGSNMPGSLLSPTLPPLLE